MVEDGRGAARHMVYMVELDVAATELGHGLGALELFTDISLRKVHPGWSSAFSVL
eukprot:EC688815.1.p3 GENE.EC688815.1~~EC688815.1.p3  ORF type:complete len:55 (-),score=7.81 EC688815.1:180-344(-)